MNVRRWIVPTLIVVALAVPVIDDLYEMVRDRGQNVAELDIDLLQEGVLRFEGRDVMIDLRKGRSTARDTAALPSYGLAEDWSPPGESGIWTLAERASFDVRLIKGGQRGLILQCRPDRRREPPPILHVSSNGFDCGSVQLARVLSEVRLELPEGAIGSGDNRLELELRSSLRPEEPASGRTLLVRRLVLAEETDADFEEIITRRAPVVRPSDASVRVQAPGTLVLEFDVPRSGAVVSFHCGFRRAFRGGGCDVVVGRWFPDRNALDVVGSARVPGNRGRGRGYRITLGNHYGPSLIRITVDERSAEAGLELRSPRLLADGA